MNYKIGTGVFSGDTYVGNMEKCLYAKDKHTKIWNNIEYREHTMKGNCSESIRNVTLQDIILDMTNLRDYVLIRDILKELAK